MNDGFEWVEHWLDVWAQDMRDPDLRLGTPSKASGFVTGGYGENRNITDDWEAEGDSRAVGVINATLQDMPPVESAALIHVKLDAVFRFKVDPQEPYRNARMKCGVRLRAQAFS